MRVVQFTIDDHAYFQRLYKLSDEQAAAMFSGTQGFRAVYTVYGRPEDDTVADRYDLTDETAQAIDLDDLNAFQRGVILSECLRYFEQRLTDRNPTGVIRVEEKFIPAG